MMSLYDDVFTMFHQKNGTMVCNASVLEENKKFHKVYQWETKCVKNVQIKKKKKVIIKIS